MYKRLPYPSWVLLEVCLTYAAEREREQNCLVKLKKEPNIC